MIEFLFKVNPGGGGYGMGYPAYPIYGYPTYGGGGFGMGTGIGVGG